MRRRCARPSPRGRGAKKNGPDQALGRSRGGWSTKLHAATLDENCALALHLTAGHAHDGRQFEALYESLEGDNVLELPRSKKATMPIASGNLSRATASRPSSPRSAAASKKLPYDKELSRGRNRVERFLRQAQTISPPRHPRRQAR